VLRASLSLVSINRARARSGTALRVGNSCDYDAFGNLINQAGSTPNNYLSAAEQFDPVLGLFRDKVRKNIGSRETVSGHAQRPMSPLV